MSIVFDHISKQYGEQYAVKDLNVEISSDEIVGFLGPNGAGKTTCMKILTSYIAPTSGNSYVQGISCQLEPLKTKQHIGYLPEHNPLYLNMYIKEYLMFIAGLYKLKNAKAAVRKVIEMTGLEKEQNKHIRNISKGYRQRVGLAQAIIHDPPVLILDEPTSGLDPNQLIEIRQLIKHIGQEKTVLFSSHIMQEIEAICDRVIILNEGVLVADESIENIMQLAGNEHVFVVDFGQAVDTQLLGALPGLASFDELAPGTYKVVAQADVDLGQELFKWASKHDYVIREMKKEVSNIESIFHKLTNQKKA